MRTFQFSDAKSHKFWTIDVTGTSFTVTYGKVGTAGQTTTKTFATPEKAQAEADKLVREKTGKGYRETTAAAPVSDAEALERGLAEHPHDTVRWSAYSDYLTERGDPRGEFMRVQLALEDESLPTAERDRLKAREAELLAAHQAEWLGPLAEFVVGAEPQDYYIAGKSVKRPAVECRFERGWPAALDFANLTVNQARAYAAAPGAKLVRELLVGEIEAESPEGTTDQYIDSHYTPGPDVPAGLDPYDNPGLHALCRVPQLAAVRTFRLGEDDSEAEYFNCHTSGELAYHLVKQMPHLEHLGLFAHRVDAAKLFALPMPNLQSLTLYHSNRYPLDKLAANPTLTNLAAIRCHPHALDYGGDDDGEGGAYIRLKHLRAICRSPHLTSLSHLGLRLTDFGDAGATEIVSSGLLKRLRVLDLRGGCMSDAGATALAASPDFRKLLFVNLQSNGLTDAGLRAIVATGVRAELGGQHGVTSPPGDDDSAEYLYEGDIE